MNELFSDDEGSVKNDEVQLTINEHYAKAFEYRKEREELERLQAKYGSDYDPDASDPQLSTDSESAESEDEHGEELTPAVDAAILRTLARIRKKDPAIYDSNKDIFGEEKGKISVKPTFTANGHTKPKDKPKPVTIRQANLDALLRGSRSPSPEDYARPLTHVEEQEKLRKETIAAFHDAVSEDDVDNFLVPRERTKDEIEREEEEYRAFLEREVGDLRDLVSVDGQSEDEQEVAPKGDEGSRDDEAEDMDRKNRKKKKAKAKSKEAAEETAAASSKQKQTKAEGDQEFLMNYILNRGWIDHSDGHVPTYNEITSTSDRRKSKGKAKASPTDLSEPENHLEDDESDNELLSDTSFESLASHFEASYNHRYEEPGAATIPSFPRNIPSVVRRVDTTRKDARERKKERKEEELAKKREEVKRLKALKMRDVKRKLELIGRQSGLKTSKGDGEEDGGFVDEALRELDLEGEWDPEKHDRQMAGLFDRGADAFEYDGADEGHGGYDGEDLEYDADGKPMWDGDIDIGDIPMSDDDTTFAKRSKKEKKKDKKKKKKKVELDDDEGVDIDTMDADAEHGLDDDEEWDGTEEMRKKKLNQYMDEIYGLEFNDMVGDLPTRFKYAQVQPTNYSLTPAEILMATDKELNEYMSVKKYAPYRQDNSDKHRWNKNNQEKLRDLKSKVTERSGGAFGLGRGRNAPTERPGLREAEDKPKKRKGKKERMKAKATVEGEDAGGDDAADAATQTKEGENKSKKRKRDEEPGSTKIGLIDIGQAVVDGDEVPKKKRKRRQKKGDHGVLAQVAQL